MYTLPVECQNTVELGVFSFPCASVVFLGTRYLDTRKQREADKNISEIVHHFVPCKVVVMPLVHTMSYLPLNLLCHVRFEKRDYLLARV